MVMQRLKNFFLNSALFGWRADQTDPTNHPYATATTPDQLIAASIMESISKDFDSWSYARPSEFNVVTRRSPPTAIQTLTKKGRVLTKVSFTFRRDRKYGVYDQPYYYRGDVESVSVNSVQISKEEGQKIFLHYKEIKGKIEKAKAVAAEAKKAMEENEKKWNLAETLLGMKRNSQGALVPAYLLEIPEENPMLTIPQINGDN